MTASKAFRLQKHGGFKNMTASKAWGGKGGTAVPPKKSDYLKRYS
jgi:hypothetical protein